MRIMIVGAGMVGYHLCEKLSVEGQEVVLIDLDKAKLRRIEKELNILPVHGSGASARTLEEAGIETTDLFIAVTDSDEANLISCIISQQYNVKTRIARVRNEDFYSPGSSLNEEALGIDLLISPDLAMADEIIKLSTWSEAFEIVEFAGGQVVMLGYVVQEDNPCAGKTLIEIDKIPGVMVAIIRGETTIIPRGNSRIESGDKVYLVTRRSDIPAIERLLNVKSIKPKNVFIIGGGTIGTLVARRMEQDRINVHLVEQNPVLCENLAEQLTNTVVLNCDGLDVNDLLEEGLDQADMVISVTDSDTTNILSSLLGKHYGAKKCITYINRTAFVPLLGKLGVDIALSPRLVIANIILRFVRGGGSIVSVATLLGSDAEIIELKVPDKEQFRDRPLKSLYFPINSVVGAIVRKGKGKVIIPTGETRLKPDDNLVIFYTKGASQEVVDFFQE